MNIRELINDSVLKLDKDRLKVSQQYIVLSHKTHCVETKNPGRGRRGEGAGRSLVLIR